MGSPVLLFLRRFWRPLAVLVWLLVVGVSAWRYLQPERQIRRKQAALFQNIIDRDVSDSKSLISSQYFDDWKFDADGIRLAMRDVSSFFMTLVITPKEESLEISEGVATYSARLVISGSGLSPLASSTESAINNLHSPFIFRWQQESWQPWSWRLIEMENEKLDVPASYRPGMLSEEGGLQKLADKALANP
jgi:hypothetical protein